MDLLELAIGETSVGIEAGRVLEVAGRVHFAPLGSAPVHVAGLLTYRGAAIAAVDLRQRLGHAPKVPSCDDQLVIVRTSRGRTVALLVDRVLGLRAGASVRPSPVRAEHIAGVVVLDDGLLLLDDIDTVLSLDDERFIDAAISEEAR